MSKRIRNYPKEHRARKRRAKRLNLSVSQARGHPRKGEESISSLKKKGLIKTPTAKSERRFYSALKIVNSGGSLTKASKKVHLSLATIHKIARERDALAKDPTTGRYRVNPFSKFPVMTADRGVFKKIAFDKLNASLMGRYWNAVRFARDSGNTNLLKPFRGKVAVDIVGNRYRLLTNLNDINANSDQMTEAEQEDFDANLYRSLRHET